MLLRKLSEFSRESETSPAPKLYAEGTLRYIIDLGLEGQCRGIVDLSDPSSPRTRRGKRQQLPQVQRTSGIRPLLLANPADYTLGLPKNEKQADRAQKCHAAYVELVERCATETAEPDILAVLNFLRHEPLEQLNLGDDFDSAGVITFRVAGRFVIDNPVVQRFWASVNELDGPTMQCLVCGAERAVLERLQSKVKGIPGGQTSGTSIISANSDAFESYGLQASQVAPVCQECAEGFTRGINSLLSSEANRFRTGNGAFVFWPRETHSFDFFTMVSAPEAQHVQALLESVRHGRWTNLDETDFYALSLSAAGGRAVVRDWLDTTVRNAKQNLAVWFQRQRIAPNHTGESPYYGVSALANTTVRDRKDLPVTTPRALIKAAFGGETVPSQILQQAIRRCQAERKVTRPRAALIKLALLSRELTIHKEAYMVEIDKEKREPGYLCGRLFAMLERAQTAAIRNVNATIADRYYGTASTAPQSVFPLLLKGARAHLHTLNRDNKGAQRRIETEIEEIMSKLDNFPKTLILEQQGYFALGYYHQRAENGRRARAASTRRQAQQGESSDAQLRTDAIDTAGAQ